MSLMVPTVERAFPRGFWSMMTEGKGFRFFPPLVSHTSVPAPDISAVGLVHLALALCRNGVKHDAGFPEPETPVNTTSFCFGIFKEIFSDCSGISPE